MKKPLMLLLVSALLAMTVAQAAFAFSDIENDPYEAEVTALKESGVLSGNPDGSFRPGHSLTNAEAVTLLNKGLDVSLARFLFNKAPLASDYFTNVGDDKWYSQAFIIAHVNNISFPEDVEPNAPVTREQFAHYLIEAILTHGDFAYPEIFIMLDDEADIDEAYFGSIQKALVLHLASAVDGKFLPKEPIKRSEAAAWVHKAIKFVANNNNFPGHEEEQPDSDLFQLELQTEAVNDSISKVTITTTVPHPGYGIRITLVEFVGDEAIIHTEKVLPDPDMMYPQVISDVSVSTYIPAEYTPVLQPLVETSSSAASGSTGFPIYE